MTVVRLLAIAYLAAGGATAFMANTAKAAGFLEAVLGIATMVAIYVWCKVESEERGTLAPGRAPLWAALFPPILLPVYFFRTRQLRRALSATGKALVLYVGLWVVFFLGALGGVLTRS